MEFILNHASALQIWALCAGATAAAFSVINDESSCKVALIPARLRIEIRVLPGTLGLLDD